jgi:hypothetical protein
MALGGIMRDLVDLLGGDMANGYVSVYAVELVVLIFTAVVLSPLVRQATTSPFSSEQRP